jgi:minor extracellular serine protease Vpr
MEDLKMLRALAQFERTTGVRHVKPVLITTMLAICAASLSGQSISLQNSETPATWFVELSSPPLADGGALAAVRNDKQNFRQAARQAGINFQERFAYDNLFNGLSVTVNLKDISKLSLIGGVKAIYPVHTLSLPPVTQVSDPNLVTAVAMTGADIAQSELGLHGDGVKVGIIDTGIDYRHPDLGGCFGPGCRVAVGWDFVGDAYDASAASPIIAPDPDPEDCAGHGTHVAGIVGANGGVIGVAPHVTFGAYRVFGCGGSSSDDVIIAAMERALSDGMNVVNMSLGRNFGWPEWPTAKAATRLVNKGVVVASSFGNEGANGLYSGAVAAVGEKVIGVASFDNTFINIPAFSISPDNKLIGSLPAGGAPPPPLSGNLLMARTGTTTATADACNPLAAGSLTGKAVLIRRGGCTFYQKVRNAQLAGAAAVALYNNVAGLLFPSAAPPAGSPAITIPVGGITAADGAVIDSRIAAGPVTLTWTTQSISSPQATGGLISSFSSYGLSPDLTLKPDLGAPGGFIRSTFPVALGSYAILSGTSMSSPHVAGAAALLLQAKPHTPSQAVAGILQNSARPANWAGNPKLGFLEAVHRQGAGMLRIDDAVLATTNIAPSTLALGESAGGSAIRTLAIQNNSPDPVTYDLSNLPAPATGPNTFAPAFLTGPATALFNPSSVTVPGHGTSSVDVTITADPTLPDRSLYGGYLIATPEGGGQAYRVPYAGFKGSYRSIQVLTPTVAGFPWLAKLVGGDSLVQQSGGASYSMVGDDIPFIAVHLDHQSRLLRLEAFDAVTGKDWHRILQEDYVSRSSAATSFFAFTWDGTTSAGQKMYTAPNGSYIIKMTVVKALGDESNPADVETWTSPPFTIARP